MDVVRVLYCKYMAGCELIVLFCVEADRCRKMIFNV